MNIRLLIPRKLHWRDVGAPRTSVEHYESLLQREQRDLYVGWKTRGDVEEITETWGTRRKWILIMGMMTGNGGGRCLILWMGGGGRGASSQNNRGAAAWHSDLSPKFQGVEIEIRWDFRSSILLIIKAIIKNKTALTYIIK